MPHVAVYDPSLTPILCLAITLVAIGQSMHVFFCAFLRARWLVDAPTAFWSRFAYECAILAFLVLEYFALDASEYELIKLGPVVSPLGLFLASSLIPLVVGAVSWVKGNHTPADAPEILAFALPPAALLLGSGTAYLLSLVVVLTFQFFHVSRVLMANERLRARAITRFSVVDAIDSLPSGLLCLGEGGRPIVMNQAMRDCMTAMGLPSDAADLTDVWSWLEEWVRVSDRSFRHSDHCLLAATPDGRYHLFERGAMEWDGRSHMTVIAADVTEEEQLNQLLERSNDLVAAAGDEIAASLERVQDVARDQALASMRSKVHDVLGQRLSIIHRYLEDGDFSDEAVASVHVLLDNLLPDLLEMGTSEPAAELEAIVSNFALINVEIAVAGELPARPEVATAFVTVIREAVTNAVRHAQATRVDVRMTGDKGGATLTVTNHNPNPSPKGIAEGNGLPNMRRVLEEVGGTMDVVDAALFTVRGVVTYPKEEA